MTLLRGLPTAPQPRLGADPPPTRLGAAVVICATTADRWDDLRRAVTSVHYQTVEALEVVVVVDHSQTLLERARRAFPGAVVVPNTHAKGLAGARNTGIAASRAPVVVFLDEAAVAERTWLDGLLSHYGDPLVVATGGEVLASWEGGRPRWFPPEFDWVVGCSYRGLPSDSAAVRTVMGGNMSFRREVFEEIGGFRAEPDPVDAAPSGWGETELCIRALQRFGQGRIVYEPAAVVHHRVPGARTSREYFAARCRAEGLSRARLCRFVGGGDARSGRRSYALRALPGGVLGGLWDGLHLDTAGIVRAAAIVSGAANVARGYLAGRRALRRAARARRVPGTTR